MNIKIRDFFSFPLVFFRVCNATNTIIVDNFFVFLEQQKWVSNLIYLSI
jgi:hypothetical protein